MKRHHLALRGLAHYWRTNLAVVLGVATAVAVLTGALVVGESVRASLRALVTDRLGRTDHAVVAATFFREALSEDIGADPAAAARFSSFVPLLVAQGFVTAQDGGQRVGGVAVYGVDDRFWRFHQMEGVTGPSDRDAFLSPALAAELAVSDGATLVDPVAAAVGDSDRVAARAQGRPGPHACASPCAGCCRARPSASSRCGRSKARCAPSSCRWPGCSRTWRFRGG